MTERERLIEIFKKIKYKAYENAIEANFIDQFSDYALNIIVDEFFKNGIIVPPCKVGDKVYQYDNGGRIYESEVVWFYYDKDYKRVVYDCNSELAFSEEAIGKSVYLSREEAAKALEGMRG